MTGRDLVVLRGREVTAAGAVALPAHIKGALSDLMTAFSTGAQRGLDKPRLLQMYADAIAGFDEAIALAALKRLLLHNPQNPFHPTPQTIYEACMAVARRAADARRRLEPLDPYQGPTPEQKARVDAIVQHAAAALGSPRTATSPDPTQTPSEPAAATGRRAGAFPGASQP